MPLKGYESLCLWILAVILWGGIIVHYLQERLSPIEIFFITDDVYAPHTGTVIASILKNASVFDRFGIHIMAHKLSPENKAKFKELKKIKNFELEFLEIDRKRFEHLPVKYAALVSYFRYIISEIAPTLDKALYLDSDLIVKKSLWELWRTDVSDVYVAAVRNGDMHMAKKFGLKTYFNGGILLFNLDKMRRDNMVEKLFADTTLLEKQKRLMLDDQDVLNYTFHDVVKYIPLKYNFDAYQGMQEDVVILHFWGRLKPWKFKRKNGDEYLNIRALTPWGAIPENEITHQK